MVQESGPTPKFYCKKTSKQLLVSLFEKYSLLFCCDNEERRSVILSHCIAMPSAKIADFVQKEIYCGYLHIICASPDLHVLSIHLLPFFTSALTTPNV